MVNSRCPDLDLTESSSPSPLLLTKDNLIGAWKPLTDCKIGQVLPLWASHPVCETWGGNTRTGLKGALP